MLKPKRYYTVGLISSRTRAQTCLLSTCVNLSIIVSKQMIPLQQQTLGKSYITHDTIKIESNDSLFSYKSPPSNGVLC